MVIKCNSSQSLMDQIGLVAEVTNSTNIVGKSTLSEPFRLFDNEHMRTYGEEYTDG